MWIPSFIDFILSNIAFLGLMFTANSVSNSLSGLSIISTLIVGKIFFNKIILKNEILGSCFVIIGSIIIGFSITN